MDNIYNSSHFTSSSQHYQYHTKTRGSSKFFPTTNFLNQIFLISWGPPSLIRVRILDCLQNDVSNTLPRFKTNEIKVIRKKLATHAHTSVCGEEEVLLAMAVILLAAVLLILHDNHKKFSKFNDECPKYGIKPMEAGVMKILKHRKRAKWRMKRKKEHQNMRCFRIWAYPLVVW